MKKNLLLIVLIFTSIQSLYSVKIVEKHLYDNRIKTIDSIYKKQYLITSTILIPFNNSYIIVYNDQRANYQRTLNIIKLNPDLSFDSLIRTKINFTINSFSFDDSNNLILNGFLQDTSNLPYSMNYTKIAKIKVDKNLSNIECLTGSDPEFLAINKYYYFYDDKSDNIVYTMTFDSLNVRWLKLKIYDKDLQFKEYKTIRKLEENQGAMVIKINNNLYSIIDNKSYYNEHSLEINKLDENYQEHYLKTIYIDANWTYKNEIIDNYLIMTLRNDSDMSLFKQQIINVYDEDFNLKYSLDTINAKPEEKLFITNSNPLDNGNFALFLEYRKDTTYHMNLYDNTGKNIESIFIKDPKIDSVGSNNFQLTKIDNSNRYLLSFKQTISVADTVKVLDVGVAVYVLDFALDVKDNYEKISESDGISPNPTTDKLLLKEIPDGATTYEIYNQLGIKVSEGEISNEINVSALPTGIYFLKIGNEYSKFVKVE